MLTWTPLRDEFLRLSGLYPGLHYMLIVWKGDNRPSIKVSEAVAQQFSFRKVGLGSSMQGDWRTDYFWYWDRDNSIANEVEALDKFERLAGIATKAVDCQPPPEVFRRRSAFLLAKALREPAAYALPRAARQACSLIGWRTCSP